MAFPITRWTIIRQLGTKTPEGRAALELLCKWYHTPVVEYLRWRGFSEDDAQDIAQRFFESLLRSTKLQEPSEFTGSFRSYIKAALENQILRWKRDRSTLGRGGGQSDVSLDANPELLDQLSDGDMFEEICSLNHLEFAIAEVAVAYQATAKSRERWAVLSPAIGTQPDLPVLAAKLGIGEESARVLFWRLDGDLKQALAGFADLETPTEADAEVRRWAKQVRERAARLGDGNAGTGARAVVRSNGGRSES